MSVAYALTSPVLHVSNDNVIPTTCTRGDYMQIVSLHGSGAATPKDIIGIYSDALPELGIEGYKINSRIRGWTAVNADLYGYDWEQDVAVIQIRQATQGRRWKVVRKTYALVGHNENGNPFRHPVSSAAVRGAVRAHPDDPKHAVKRVQSWMWDCSILQLEEALASGCRQGDVLMVRVRKSKSFVALENRVIVLGDSHKILASSLYKDSRGDGSVIALNPSMIHTKGQHDPVCAPVEGYYSIRLAREARSWTFGERVGD